jgi:hypothetical protein
MVAGHSVTGIDMLSKSPSTSGAMSAYDSSSHTVWVDDITTGVFVQYDPATNCYVQRSTSFPQDMGTTMAVDPVNHLLYSFGTAANGTSVAIGKVDISGNDATYAYSALTTTGCTGIAGSGKNWPGVARDPSGVFVIYPNNGNTLYVFDPVALTCTPFIFGTPNVPSITNNGTFGKFAYIPSINRYVITDWWNNDAFAFQLQLSSGVSGSPTFTGTTLVIH